MHAILSTHIPSETNASTERRRAESDEDNSEDEDEGFGARRVGSSGIRNGGGIGTGMNRVPKGGSKARVDSDDEFDL